MGGRFRRMAFPIFYAAILLTFKWRCSSERLVVLDQFCASAIFDYQLQLPTLTRSLRG